MLRDFLLSEKTVNCVLIFLSKVSIIVFGYRSLEKYLNGHAWTASLIDTVFFLVAVWSSRIIIADKSNPALACASAGIFVGTFIATKLRKIT